jgi:hypothetical protein
MAGFLPLATAVARFRELGEPVEKRSDLTDSLNRAWDDYMNRCHPIPGRRWVTYRKPDVEAAGSGTEPLDVPAGP